MSNHFNMKSENSQCSAAYSRQQLFWFDSHGLQHGSSIWFRSCFLSSKWNGWPKSCWQCCHHRHFLRSHTRSHIQGDKVVSFICLEWRHELLVETVQWCWGAHRQKVSDDIPWIVSLFRLSLSLCLQVVFLLPQGVFGQSYRKQSLVWITPLFNPGTSSLSSTFRMYGGRNDMCGMIWVLFDNGL